MEKVKIKAVKHLEQGVNIIEALIEDARARVEFCQIQIEIAEEDGEQAAAKHFKEELVIANEQVYRMIDLRADYMSTVIVARDAIINAEETFNVFAKDILGDN